MMRSLIVATIVAGVSFAGGCGKRIGYGIDSFVKDPPDVVKGKRLGLITNHTGADSKAAATSTSFAG